MATPELDTEELKQLALQAVRADRPKDAIRLLEEAVFRDPGRADLRYLLGAMHAQIGLVARGIEEIGKALALAPELHPARFQLGLLHFSRAEYEQAESVWAPLHEALAEDDALRLFVLGLGRLVREDSSSADVETMAAARAAGGDAGANASEPPAARRHVLISRYQQQDEGS